MCKKYFVAKISERLEGITVTDRNVKIYSDFFVFSIYTWITGSDSRDDVEFIKDLKNSVVFGAELAHFFTQDERKQISDSEITMKYRIISK